MQAFTKRPVAVAYSVSVVAPPTQFRPTGHRWWCKTHHGSGVTDVRQNSPAAIGLISIPWTCWKRGLNVTDIHLKAKVLLSSFKVRSNRRRKTAVTFRPWKQALCSVFYLNANWKRDKSEFRLYNHRHKKWKDINSLFIKGLEVSRENKWVSSMRRHREFRRCTMMKMEENETEGKTFN